MDDLILAITLEALRQRISDSLSPDEFFGTTTIDEMVDHGLDLEAWRTQICKTHDRYVGYVEPGNQIVTFCRGCLHRHVQQLFTRDQTLEHLDHLIRKGVDVPEGLGRALDVFMNKEE